MEFTDNERRVLRVALDDPKGVVCVPLRGDEGAYEAALALKARKMLRQTDAAGGMIMYCLTRLGRKNAAQSVD